MRIQRIKSILIKGFFLVAACYFLSFLPSKAQSSAYKTVLSGLYDESFPVVYPKQIFDLNQYQVLDTREKEEFAVSHLPKAQWVGYETFSLESVQKLDKNKPVLVYCTVGARSQDIGKRLVNAGFTRVYNLYGGIIHWVNEGKQVEVDGHPTSKVHTYSKAWGIWLSQGKKVY